MKIWKVDYFCAYSNTDLEDKLNGMEINGRKVHTILFNPSYNEYEIIYTIEDEVNENE